MNVYVNNIGKKDIIHIWPWSAKLSHEVGTPYGPLLGLAALEDVTCTPVDHVNICNHVVRQSPDQNKYGRRL